MAILGYEPNIRCALANAPDFPLDDKELAVSTDPISLDEWCSYFVKFYDDIPEFFDKVPYRDQSNQWKFPGNIFLINFKNSVGLTRIESLCLWIKNQKIGEEAFYTLLEFISDHYANLVSDWNTTTGYAHRQDTVGRNTPYIELLLLKKYLLSAEQSLESLVTAILSDPHRRLCREMQYQPIERVAALEPALIMAGLSKSGNTVELRPDHPLLDTALGRALAGNTARNLYLEQVLEERKYHSYDTPENRFIKHVLSDIQERLKQLQNVLDGSVNYLNPTLDKDLAALQTQVQGSLEDPLWREVEFMRLVPSSSPVLQRKEGYRQLFSLYALLQLLTRYDLPCFDFSHLLESKDTATLFEYWCFFLIKDILDKQFGKPKHYYELVTGDPRNQKLVKGISLEYENGFSFRFNHGYSHSDGLKSTDTSIVGYQWGDSYSHTLYPDFSLHYQERILILDAKYKGEREGFYGETGNGIIESWKQEDIIKMHAYRDAIASAVGAFILYPGYKTVFYPSFNATRCCQGVGAIALRPDLNAQPEESGRQLLRTLIQEFIGIDGASTNSSDPAQQDRTILP
jgi:predicted component of viral defense system (DUF524 family)